MFQLSNVGLTYNDTRILRGLTCDIPTTGFVFVMGPSGSGKSSLLRLLSFIEQPTCGTLILDLAGERYSPLGIQRPWPQLTCVFQRQFLWPHMTLRENITLPLKAQGIRDVGAALQPIIERFAMEGFIDRYPNEVSGGQAQRAALARALVLKPSLVLIDEAHGGLDLAQQSALNAHLVSLRQAGIGLIVVTHSLEFAKRYADTIIVVEGGQITEMGSPALLDDPKSEFMNSIAHMGLSLSGDAGR